MQSLSRKPFIKLSIRFSDLSQNITDALRAASKSLTEIRVNETSFIEEYAVAAQGKLRSKLRGIMNDRYPEVAQAQRSLELDQVQWPKVSADT